MLLCLSFWMGTHVGRASCEGSSGCECSLLDRVAFAPGRYPLKYQSRTTTYIHFFGRDLWTTRYQWWNLNHKTLWEQASDFRFIDIKFAQAKTSHLSFSYTGVDFFFLVYLPLKFSSLVVVGTRIGVIYLIFGKYHELLFSRVFNSIIWVYHILINSSLFVPPLNKALVPTMCQVLFCALGVTIVEKTKFLSY